MDTEEEQEVTVHVWPFSTVCWFGMAGVATLLDLSMFFQRVSPLFTSPIAFNPNPAPAPPVELFEIPFRSAQFLFFVVVGPLPLLIILVAVWRRWANAGIHQTNYWVWTSIQGSIAAIILLPMLLKVFVFYTSGLPSCIPGLIWVFHTFARPNKSRNRAETSPPRLESS